MPHPTERVGVSSIRVAAATTVIAPWLGWIACTGLLLGSDMARAETSREFWPEFNAYLKLNERTRAYLLATSSRTDTGDGPNGAWSSRTQGTLGAHLDYSLTPVLRPDLLDRDWARNRYLWMRVGYQYSSSLNDSDSDTGFHENRGVFQVTGRTPPLAGDLEWIARARWDLRDRNGQDSSLYRLRLGFERQFDLHAHAVVPYFHAETIYDTRYDAWKQQRYQAGVEVTLSGPWRIKPYLEARNDNLSQPAHVRAFGLILQYYR
jgi:hypothetical protein